MRLQLVKFEDLEQWGILNSTMETMLPFTFHDQLHGLLWLAFVELEGLRFDSKMQEHYHTTILRWLNDVAPHYRRPSGKWENGVRFPSITGDRIIPDSWALALVDRMEWDEESMARKPELLIADLIELLEMPKYQESTARYLLEQFGEWEPIKK